MNHVILKVLVALGLAACGDAAVRPGTPLHSVAFAEPPHIVLRGNEFFLRYRIAVSQPPYQMRRLVYAKKAPEKADMAKRGPCRWRRPWRWAGQRKIIEPDPGT